MLCVPPTLPGLSILVTVGWNLIYHAPRIGSLIGLDVVVVIVWGISFVIYVFNIFTIVIVFFFVIIFGLLLRYSVIGTP